MDFLRAINQESVWLSSAIVFVVTVVVVPGCQLLIRRHIGVESLIVNNEVAGFKYAVLGVAYAVLLALVTIVVWEEFREAEATVEAEARAVLDLNRLAAGLAPADAARLRGQLRAYAGIVVTEEWPRMATGQSSPAAAAALSAVFETLIAAPLESPEREGVRQTAMSLALAVADNRQQRLESAEGTIPPMLWLALVIGTATTLGFTLFFGSPNALAQGAMTAMLGLTVGMVVLVTILLDLPFTGLVSIPPAPMAEVLAMLTAPAAPAP